jgi:Mor family transcriptional regulator
MGLQVSFSNEDILEDAAVLLEKELTRAGIGKKATEISVNVVQCLREHWGGQSVYFSKGAKGRFHKRNQEIFKAFNGLNYCHLARKHGLTEMRIRQIVKNYGKYLKVSNSSY